MMKSSGQGGTMCERALWAFLGVTLVGPFLAALIIFLSSVVAGLMGRGPGSLIALDQAGQLAWAGQKAIETYVWSAIPAGICGAILAAIVYKRGTAHWLAGASLGAVVSSVLAVLAGGMMQQHLTPIAFIGAISGVAMIVLLRRAKIIF